MELSRPERIAYDRPSPKLVSFIAKHYKLSDYKLLPNRFAVFDYYLWSTDAHIRQLMLDPNLKIPQHMLMKHSRFPPILSLSSARVQTSSYLARSSRPSSRDSLAAAGIQSKSPQTPPTSNKALSAAKLLAEDLSLIQKSLDVEQVFDASSLLTSLSLPHHTSAPSLNPHAKNLREEINSLTIDELIRRAQMPQKKTDMFRKYGGPLVIPTSSLAFAGLILKWRLMVGR